MNSESALRILLDNSVLSLSDTMQGVAKEFQTTILGDPKTYRVAGYERRPLPRQNEVWKREQINCLPTVARLAREGQVRMYSTPELRHEAWKRPDGFPANRFGRLFADIKIEELDTPIERSRFFQLPIEEYIKPECMIGFCKWLLEVDGEMVANWDWVQAACQPFEITNLRSLDRYRELCRGLGEAQYPDAFHLWSGELHGMSYFLTTDGRFIRAVTTNKRLRPKCMPVCPSDLLIALNITERDPFPYQHGETIGVFGQPL